MSRRVLLARDLEVLPAAGGGLRVRRLWGLRFLRSRTTVSMDGVARFAVAFIALGCVTAFSSGNALAQARANIDFEGLPEGMIVSQLTTGSGIAGDPVAGSIAVFGDRAPVGDGSTNAAMI
jgi:hypothetical protein